MACYSWELAQTIRAALDEVMTKIPADEATSAVAKVAVVIFQATAKAADQLSRPDERRVRPDSHNNFRADFKGEKP
jgi:hypothetical protein